jgi:hypothetical protein
MPVSGILTLARHYSTLIIIIILLLLLLLLKASHVDERRPFWGRLGYLLFKYS